MSLKGAIQISKIDQTTRPRYGYSNTINICNSEINGNQLGFDNFVIMIISKLQSRIDGAPVESQNFNNSIKCSVMWESLQLLLASAERRGQIN